MLDVPQTSEKLPTEKKFDSWNKLKSNIHFSDNIPAGYKERDVWWVAIGHNIGTEEDGKGQMFNRPVLVIKGFNKYLFWGIPLSTTSKKGVYYHQFLISGVISSALLSQLRAYDTKRLISKYGMVNQKDFLTIKNKIAKLLE